MSDFGIDERLEELARRTAPIGPSPGFRERVLAAIGADLERSFGVELLRSARTFLPLALVVTVLALGWASRNEHSVNSELALAEQPLELEW